MWVSRANDAYLNFLMKKYSYTVLNTGRKYNQDFVEQLCSAAFPFLMASMRKIVHDRLQEVGERNCWYVQVVQKPSIHV